MKYLFTLLLSFTFFSGFAQLVSFSVQHDGLTRSYSVYIPPGIDLQQEHPLLFNLHGLGSNGGQQLFYTDMNSVADTGSFFVCYPNGVNNSWNTGFDPDNEIDDVGFINLMISEISSEYPVDLSRVYSCGMSNGGYMSHFLACELTTKFAAVASVTGSMTPAKLAECSPSNPIPVMQIHGTADDVVPYDGGNFSAPIEDVVDFWVQYNNCNSSPTVTQVPDVDPNDLCTAERFDYNDCDEGTAVAFYKVTGGGHTWPGAVFPIGITNQDFNASIEIWRFFKQFQSSTATSTENLAQQSAQVKVFPNPVQEELIINVENGLIKAVEVYNSVGQQILAENIGTSQRTSFNTNSWNPGIYIFKIHSSNGISTHKVIKN